MPIVENLFLQQDKKKWNRYHFTIVFNREFFKDPNILNLEIDIRFVRQLIRNTISLKLN